MSGISESQAWHGGGKCLTWSQTSSIGPTIRICNGETSLGTELSLRISPVDLEHYEEARRSEIMVAQFRRLSMQSKNHLDRECMDG